MRTTQLAPWSVRVMLCVALIVILGAAGASPALALQDTAMGNAPLWYKFHVGRVGDDNSSNVSVTLRSQTACSGGFQVFTGGPWRLWDQPTEGDWMGVATDIGNDMYMWTGNVVPGAYYVRLGSGAQPACVLGVSGQAVDYVGVVDMGWHIAETEDSIAASSQYILVEPTVASADFKLAVVEPAGAKSELAAPALKLAAASPAVQKADFVNVEPVATAHSMDDMEVVPGVWMPVTSNEAMIFTFYVGHAPDESTSSVSITLYGEPYRAGQFQLFTGSGATVAQPEPESWMGHSYEEDGKYPVWYGELVPGVYKVRVEPQGMRDCMLAVSGVAVTY